ncbi:MAG: DUF2191 domain-containing protein [Thermoanaerobaculia bacterium]
MKTTVEIADPVLVAAKETAIREGTTLRSLVEEGLRLALERRHRGERFRLRNASVDGEGLQPGLEGVSWDLMRDLAYENRGS